MLLQGLRRSPAVQCVINMEIKDRGRLTHKGPHLLPGSRVQKLCKRGCTDALILSLVQHLTRYSRLENLPFPIWLLLLLLPRLLLWVHWGTAEGSRRRVRWRLSSRANPPAFIKYNKIKSSQRLHNRPLLPRAHFTTGSPGGRMNFSRH